MGMEFANQSNRFFRFLLYLILDFISLLNPFRYFYPRTCLENSLRQLIDENYYSGFKRIIFYKSGRSALAALLQNLKNRDADPRILLPDYICNVVYKAAKLNDFCIKSYSTDKQYRPQLDDLITKIKEENIHVVLLASIFGAQNNSGEIIRLIRSVQPDAIIILDECQNLIFNSPIEPDERTIVILSFNKNIHGVFGGALCFTDDFLEMSLPKSSYLWQLMLEITVCGSFFRRIIDRLRWEMNFFFQGHPAYPIPHIEYSLASSPQYNLLPEPITRISLSQAINGLKRIHRIENLHRRNFEVIKNFVEKNRLGEIQVTANIENTCYIPLSRCSKEISQYFYIKGPYALDENPTVPGNPNGYSVINLGTLYSYYLLRD